MVTLEKIQEAKSCIQDSVRKTPVLNCPKLGAKTGNDVYFKLENLQQTGSFKLRGALNKIAHLKKKEKKCKHENKWNCDFKRKNKTILPLQIFTVKHYISKCLTSFA